MKTYNYSIRIQQLREYNHYLNHIMLNQNLVQPLPSLFRRGPGGNHQRLASEQGLCVARTAGSNHWQEGLRPPHHPWQPVYGGGRHSAGELCRAGWKVALGHHIVLGARVVFIFGAKNFIDYSCLLRGGLYLFLVFIYPWCHSSID